MDRLDLFFGMATAFMIGFIAWSLVFSLNQNSIIDNANFCLDNDMRVSDRDTCFYIEDNRIFYCDIDVVSGEMVLDCGGGG